MCAAKNLTGLRPQVYEHPSDTAALNALTSTLGLEKVIRKFNEWGTERFLRVQLTGSYLRVTADSFPDLHRTFITARERIDLPMLPDFYIMGGGEINAFTAGVEKPVIAVTSAAVELLEPEELLFVLAHEMGHIKSAHILYYQVAECLPLLADLVATLTIGTSDFFMKGVALALLHWKRMSEFTADRAGLLGCQDAEVALRTLMKLSGLPPKYFSGLNTEDLIAQARDFRDMDTDKLTKVAKWLSVMGATHPWTVLRAQQLLQWIDDKKYDEAVAWPQYVPNSAGAHALPIQGYCRFCGWGLLGTEVFCRHCGKEIVAGSGR